MSATSWKAASGGRADRVRITVELVDAVEGDQVWTERYDRVLEDIFDVQDEIAQAIASQLKIELISKQRLVEKPTSNEEAYQLYLRGRHLIYRLTGESMQKGLDLVKQARELDPAFVQAYAVESFDISFSRYWVGCPPTRP